MGSEILGVRYAEMYAGRKFVLSFAKRLLCVIASILVLCLLFVVGYVAYLQITYYRIEDNLVLEVENNQTQTVATGNEYSVATYNVGFGAYSPSFSFFCDVGNLNGKATTGTHGTALSKEDVENNTEGALTVLKDQDADFLLVQEVDTGSTRNYGVDQLSSFKEDFQGYSSVYAVNSHTAFFIYPFTDMYGSANSGLLTLSRFRADGALRRSYPISSSFLQQFVDLDRCFSVTRYPVEDGHELVIVNSHMSAYDDGNSSKTKQMEMLNELLEEEAKAGNYVIVGGDWNQSFVSYTTYETQETYDEQILFEDSSFAEGYHIVYPENVDEVATCRNADIPYELGVSLRLCIDGFVVSDNIYAESVAIDTEFKYSDHNPVKMNFVLRAQ